MFFICHAMLNLSVADRTVWLIGAWPVYFHTSEFHHGRDAIGRIWRRGGWEKRRKHGGIWALPSQHPTPHSFNFKMLNQIIITVTLILITIKIILYFFIIWLYYCVFIYVGLNPYEESNFKLFLSKCDEFGFQYLMFRQVGDPVTEEWTTM